MILMRSGIGPEEELKKLEKHGYESRLVRPGVGKALSDRYEYGVVSRLQEPSTIAAGASLDFGPNDRFFQEWKQGKGPYTTNGDFSALEIKTDPSLDAPNVMALDVIGRFTGYRVGYADEALKDPSLVTHLVLDAHRGDQRGFLTVNPDDPFKPDINFAYHEDDVLRANGLGDDRSVIAHQIENVARPIRDKARVVKEEVFPGDQVRGHDALKEAVGKGTWGHHPVRTCKMGKASDPDAVCDSRFNVIGTQGLRVIDASIFPGNMGTFLVSSVMLAAEKGADLLDREAKLADGDTQSPLAVSIQQRSK
ncbi:MAG: GMC oxidoreductase, partial [Myxococcota bacterium]